MSRCDHCGGDAVDGSTCPRSLPCPRCHAPADAPCKRPSGHAAPALHSARIAAAESTDDHDQARGVDAIDVARDALTLEGEAQPLPDPPADPRPGKQLPLADFGPPPMPGQTGLDL